MVKISVKNLDDFIKTFKNARPIVKQTLRAAFPEYYEQMNNAYKKATQITKTLKDKIKTNKPEVVKGVPNKNLDSAFDTLYGKGNQEAQKAKVNTPKTKVGKGLKVGKGGGLLAAAQGLMNLNDPNATTVDKARGATMFGTGALGLATANPWLLGTAGALAIGDALAEPVGNAIGDWIYKPKDVVYNPNYTRLDITHDLKGNPYTPEEQQKIIAYNDAQDAKIAAQYGQAMAPFKAPVEPEVTNTVGQIPSNYSNPVASQPRTQSEIGFVPQSFQNGQEGGLNNYQDILQGNNISPSLKPIVEPVNYSNEYLMKANDISNKLQGVQGEQMENINPYAQLRGYTDVNNQLAPVPNQPQNIREDVLPEYLQVMEGIRGKQDGLNYADILNQYNAATEADRRQNQLNQMVNAFGGLGRSGKVAPIYYVGANGKLNAIEQDQPAEVNMLPTNTSSNADRFLGQLKIQQAQQADALAQQKLYRDILKAQQERQDMMAQATALAKQFGGRPEMYMNKDVVQSLLSQTINPNIQARANVMEAIGKAPTQDQLKAAEQYRTIAGKLDEVQLDKQFDTQIAQINNQAKLIQTQLEQSGMDRRMAAQLANQVALNQYTQLMQNTRAMMEDQRARDLAVYGRGTQESVANIYANARGGSKGYDEQEAMAKDWNTLIGSGTPIPQAIKYMQVRYPNFGLSQAEQAELNRR